MTIDQAAAYLGLSAYTLRAMCRSRALPHYRVGPRKGRILIDRQDCDAYLARARVERAPQQAAAGAAAATSPRGGYRFQFFEPGTRRRLMPPAAR